ncbi:MAG: amino acid ABC transporter permease [Oscillospiraceae bacterium]|nr:amino acid ABC transporter permease [Oscillospiraceae bacterium]
MPADFFGRIIFILQNYGSSMLEGAGRTLIIALVGTAIGCVIGFVCGVVKTIPIEKNDGALKRVLLRAVHAIIDIYVEVFRGTPMMVQAMFIYYGVAKVFGLVMSMWFAAFFVVSINTGAYMAETVRGGILSIDPGQTEGAKAIGMTHTQTMLNVIIPQALRNIMPQIGNNLIINIKDTCVLSAISVVELFFASRSVAGTYYVYFETFTITMVMYLIMTVFFSRLLLWFERKMDGPANYDLATTDQLAHTSGMYSHPGIDPDSTNPDLRERQRSKELSESVFRGTRTREG